MHVIVHTHLILSFFTETCREKMSKTGKMQQWLNYKIRVTTSDKRDIVGYFLAFDRHMNIIVADADEFRRIGGKGKKEAQTQKRTLGLILLRGENIVSISIEGPPPPVRYSSCLYFFLVPVTISPCLPPIPFPLIYY